MTVTRASAGGSNDLARLKAAVADLVGGVVEEVGKLAEHLGLEVELLLLLAPVVDGLLQMLQPVIHVVVKGLKGMQGLVVALVNDMPEVRHAKGAETTEDGGGIQIRDQGVLRLLVVGGLPVAVLALPVLRVQSADSRLFRVVVGCAGDGAGGGVCVDLLLGGGDGEKAEDE